MTKAELIERIARSRALPPDITKKDIDKIVTLAFEELGGWFARAKVTRTQTPKFSFPRFGTFVKKRRSARRGVNPRTLEPMQIDAFYTLDFRTSGELRDAMNVARPASETGRKRGRAEPAIVASLEPTTADEQDASGEHDGDEQLPAARLARVRANAGSSRARTG
ncbi:MAG TPA: HU family DNA-binding protein [Nannocystaceae bacterium]|nr:HU family DNA-binding protein [Nannocystaceae bacterium]